MKFNLKRFIFFITGLLLLSCNNDDDIDPQNTSDLSIVVEAGSATPAIGTRLVFTLTATNNGPLDATEVVVKNKIPSGYTFDSFDATSGDYDSTTGIWTIGGLKNQETVNINIIVIINPAGDYNNTASISGAQADLGKKNSSASTVFKPIIVTDDMLFTYTVSEGNDKFVTITGLSQLWEDLLATNKFDLKIPGVIQGYPVKVIGENAFYQKEKIVSVSLPNSIISIAPSAFFSCKGIERMIIPNSITAIGDRAFYLCTNLKSMDIPGGVTSIGRSVFSYCTSLESVIIPNSLKTISYGAFYECTGLKTVVLPDNLTEIDRNTFYSCSSLVSINIPNSVEYIKESAFERCYKLQNIKIPNNLKKIENKAFLNCTSLTNFAIESNSYFSVIDGVLYDKNVTRLWNYPTGKSGSFSIPETVTTISGTAFAVSKLTSVYIPNSVVTIEESAFNSCMSLKTVTIPSSVKTIKGYTFAYTSLKSVIMNPTAPPVTSNLFYKTDNLVSIKVPAGSLEAYKNADGWSEYKNIISAQ